jgi:hypothetical protein
VGSLEVGIQPVFTAGDNLYLTATAGQYTTTKPTTGKVFFVGKVVRAASDGMVFVSPLAEVEGARVIVSDTAPANPAEGDLWFDNTTLELYIYYDDGTTAQWVGIGGGGGGGGAEVLNDLTDVVITSPDNNELLIYNGTSWVNQAGTSSLVGLGNVNNTSDVNKPVSTATQTALNLKADLVNGLVPANQLPSFVDDVLEFANLASFPATGEQGKIYVAVDTSRVYRWTGAVYVEIANTLDFATQAEAEAGTNTTKVMNPARTKDAILATHTEISETDIINTTSSTVGLITGRRLNHKLQVVSALPASPLAGVFYFILE